MNLSVFTNPGSTATRIRLAMSVTAVIGACIGMVGGIYSMNASLISAAALGLSISCFAVALNVATLK